MDPKQGIKRIGPSVVVKMNSKSTEMTGRSDLLTTDENLVSVFFVFMVFYGCR